ncbi:MAG TPA: nucleoside-diphosphate kinase [Planctomycetota bacterium]|nr:nucleoside-diphosphate kinase [Planctomycetota bacterium]
MRDELAYALITPYSLLKSRTGGIIGRMLSLGDLELAGARMFAPSDEMIDAYTDTITRQQDMDPQIKQAFVRYLNDYFRPQNALGIANRTMLLLLRGPSAVEVLKEQVVGAITKDPRGDTIRGTYGDFISVPGGEILYFEPAVLIGTNREMVDLQLGVLAEYATTDGGVLEHVLDFPDHANVQTTLVILKPENFKRKSTRPGNLIDMFSRTGLYIVGAKLLHMSVRQAEQFYGPLKAILREKLKSNVAKRLKDQLQPALGFAISAQQYEAMADILAENNATFEFNRIVEYMAGTNPDKVSEQDKDAAGKETCLALLYQGVNAVEKIRATLGATNPASASPGTVRSVYANDLMRNAAHASDSPESATRERQIVDLAEPERRCDVKAIIEQYLGQKV